MYRLELKIMGLPDTLNARKTHWAAKMLQARKWKENVVNAIILGKHPRPESPLQRAKLVLTRYSSASRPPDFDNLVGSFKNCLDGLKEAGILIDDNPLIIGQPEYKWEQTNPKKGHITIVVEEVA